MAPQAYRQIQHELDLIERFAGSYHRQFTEAIARLNAAPSLQTNGQSLRLCVETLDMVLAAMGHMTEAIRHLNELAQPAPDEMRKAA